jgi:hypothetical protein
MSLSSLLSEGGYFGKDLQGERKRDWTSKTLDKIAILIHNDRFD